MERRIGIFMALAAGALPAAAQIVARPVPRFSVLLSPAAAPLPAAPLPALTLPALSVPRPSPVPAVMAAPAPRVGSAANAAAPAAPETPRADGLVVREGASQAFYERVLELTARLPPGVLRTARELGYTIQVKEHVTQGRPDLRPIDDGGGGLHEWGEKGSFIIVSEKVSVMLPDPDGVLRGRTEWQDSLYWENAVIHELGHVLDRAFGLTAALRADMDADFADMPEELKSQIRPDGSVNRFHYFLQPSEGRLGEEARKEVVAEGFDVLLRGEASSYNYRNFTAHFPRTLAALRAALEERLGPL